MLYFYFVERRMQVSENSGHDFSSYFKRAVSPLMVLALLRGNEMYGYEITQEINRRTNKKLSIAVLYPVLYRLEEQGYVRIANTVIENGRARNYYATTQAGEDYLDRVYGDFLELSALFRKIVEGENT